MGKPRNRKQVDAHLNICSRLETQSCACVWEPNPRVQRLGIQVRPQRLETHAMIQLLAPSGTKTPASGAFGASIPYIPRIPEF